MRKQRKPQASSLSVAALWGRHFEADTLEIFLHAFHNAGIAVKVIGIDGELNKAKQHGELQPDITIDNALAEGLGQKASHLLVPCDYDTFWHIEDDPNLKAFLTQASMHNAQFIGNAGVVHHLIHNRTSERRIDWVYDKNRIELQKLAQRVALEALSNDRGAMLN